MPPSTTVVVEHSPYHDVGATYVALYGSTVCQLLRRALLQRTIGEKPQTVGGAQCSLKIVRRHKYGLAMFVGETAQ